MAEIDPRRLAVSLLNHPGATGVPGDLRLTWRQVIREYRNRAGDKRPALLCACPPCQGMSSARSGKGRHDDVEAGSKDTRNLLVTVIARVAKELMPALIVVENVPAFLTRQVRHPKQGTPVSAANYLIEALNKQYAVFPLVADLCQFGVPQTRNRAFLTFIRRDLPALRKLQRLGRAPFPRPTHSDSDTELRPVTLTQALAAFNLPKLDAANLQNARADGYGGMHAVPVWNERMYEMVSAIPPGRGGSAWQNTTCSSCGEVAVEPADSQCPVCKGPLLRPVVVEKDGSIRLIRGFKSSYRRMHPDKPAATITTASGHVGSDLTIHPDQNRLLSVLECALLQTFPATFKWGNSLKEYGHTNIREMIGEAVPPAFTKLHGEVLLGLLKGQWTKAPIAAAADCCTRAASRLGQLSLR